MTNINIIPLKYYNTLFDNNDVIIIILLDFIFILFGYKIYKRIFYQNKQFSKVVDIYCKSNKYIRLFSIRHILCIYC